MVPCANIIDIINTLGLKLPPTGGFGFYEPNHKNTYLGFGI